MGEHEVDLEGASSYIAWQMNRTLQMQQAESRLNRAPVTVQVEEYVPEPPFVTPSHTGQTWNFEVEEA